MVNPDESQKVSLQSNNFVGEIHEASNSSPGLANIPLPSLKTGMIDTSHKVSFCCLPCFPGNVNNTQQLRNIVDHCHFANNKECFLSCNLHNKISLSPIHLMDVRNSWLNQIKIQWWYSFSWLGLAPMVVHVFTDAATT